MDNINNIDTINHCFKVSDIPQRFRIGKNGTKYCNIDIDKYDLQNADLYSEQGKLIERGSQQDYNTLFLLELDNLYFDEVKEFLNYQYTFSTRKVQFLNYVKLGTIHSSILKDNPIIIESIKQWIADFDDFKNLLNIENGLKISLSEHYDNCLKDCVDTEQFERITYDYYDILVPVNHLKLNLLFNGELKFNIKNYTSKQQILVNKDILANAFFLGYKKGVKNFDKEYKPKKKELFNQSFLRTIKTLLENEISDSYLTLLTGINPLGFKGWGFVKDNIPMVADKNVFHAFGYYQAHFDKATTILSYVEKNKNTNDIIKISPKSNPYDKVINDNWFKAGRLMYEDENFHQKCSSLGVTPTLKEYYRKYLHLRQYFDGTIKNYNCKHKNLFLRKGGEQMTLLHQYCSDNDIKCCNSFKLICDKRNSAQ